MTVPDRVPPQFPPDHYLNRELSWLEFNARVLEEAADPSNPWLERLKFLAIFSSNLDEFFEIRVAGLQQQVYSSRRTTGPTAWLPRSSSRRSTVAPTSSWPSSTAS